MLHKLRKYSLFVFFIFCFSSCGQLSYPRETLVSLPEQQFNFFPNDDFSIETWNCKQEDRRECRGKVIKSFLKSYPYQEKIMAEIRDYLGESTGYFNTETNLAYAFTIQNKAYSLAFVRPDNSTTTLAYILEY